jgi:hypothetical protein
MNEFFSRLAGSGAVVLTMSVVGGGMVLVLFLTRRWWRQRIASPPRHAALWQSIGERQEIAGVGDAQQLRKTGYSRSHL